MDWLREHPMLALGVGALAVFLVIRSVAQKNQQGGANDGSGAQGDIGSGQVVSAGGYTFVPTGSSDQSSTQSGDVNPNTAEELTALTGFLQQFQAGAPPATPAVPPGSNGTPSQTPWPVDPHPGPAGPPGPTGPRGPRGPRGPKSTKHTHGTPPQVSGVPIVAKHPHNPSPLPPVRMPPVKHPVQGKNHPTGGPIMSPPHLLVPPTNQVGA